MNDELSSTRRAWPTFFSSSACICVARGDTRRAEFARRAETCVTSSSFDTTSNRCRGAGLFSLRHPAGYLSQCRSMAASPSQRGTARAPPPPDQLATFYKLVDKQVAAGLLCREARDAELSAQAAVQAETLFGDDSLVVASLRMCESVAHAQLAAATSGAERQTLLLWSSTF